jgi:hypothetical protein
MTSGAGGLGGAGQSTNWLKFFDLFYAVLLKQKFER